MLCNDCIKFEDCKLRNNDPASIGSSVESCPEHVPSGQLQNVQPTKNENRRKYSKSVGVKKYLFGSYNSTQQHTMLMARSYDQAILEFKLTCINPEQHVRAEDRINRYEEDDEIQSKYKSSYKLKPNPQILIEENEEQEFVEKNSIGMDNTVKRWVKISERLLPLSECIDVDLKDLTRILGMLEPQIQGKNPEECKEYGITVRNGSILPTQFSNKSEIIAKRDLLDVQKQKLELEARKLQEMIHKLNKEIKEKTKILNGIMIYQGIDCDCYQLLNGEKAPNEAKLSIYQEKLYIDSETAVYTCRYGERSFDYRNLDEFEEFIKINFKQYHYEPLSVIAWQIRRFEKDYGDPWENMARNGYNFITLVTIRNGDNLYELIPDHFHIGSTTFPRSDELEKIYERRKDIISSSISIDDELKAYYEKHMFTLLFIQGIVDRTDLLGNIAKGVNLITGDKDKINLIRDAETKFCIDDGHEDFYSWVERNRNSIDVGSRVAYLGSKGGRWSSSDPYQAKRNSIMRTGMSWIDFPKSNEIYVINKIGEWYSEYGDSKQQYYQFSYLPNEELSYASVRKKSYNGSRDAYERTRRIGFKAYQDELINVDACDRKELDYFLGSRKYRHQYERMLPVLTVIFKILKKEEAEEQNFKKLIVSELGFEISSDELEKFIKDFKTKRFGTSDERKWKRGLMADGENGAAAVRQIVKSIKKVRKSND